MDEPRGALARIGLWLLVLGVLFGPLLVALKILEFIAPIWFQYGDRGRIYMATWAISIILWVPLFAVLVQARFGDDD